MNSETISRAQLLLQYYSALAELEQEGRWMASHDGESAADVPGLGRVERMRQSIVLQKEMRISA